MNASVHDLGGHAGFGRVEMERGEPVFHAPWEGRVLGMVYVALARGLVNIDAFRHGIERMAPGRYLAATYYDRWLTSLETVLPEAGVLAPGFVPKPHAQAGYARAADRPPRFAAGARVRTTTRKPEGHTRLPGYAAEKRGVVTRAHGAFVFPDSNAHGGGEQPQHLYTVRFDARELWGGGAEPGASVHVDLFEPYLEVDESAARHPDVA